MFRLIPLFTIFAIGISLSGCSDAFLPKVKTGSVKILKNAIEVEFTQLTREFGQLDLKGDLGLCDPVLFGVARFAVYQAVEEKRTATMAQLTRFIMRARAAIKRAEEKIQKKQCVDTDGDGLTDLTEYRKYKTKPDNADTDGDKVSDSLEVRRYRTDPLKADTDGDLLDDGDEISRGLNPLLADSDGDGFIDGIEIAHNSNARDACSQPLDAQRLDRLRECKPKKIHIKRNRVQTPQKQTPKPAPKAKRTPDKKRKLKAQEPKMIPSAKSAERWAPNIKKANFNEKKPKQTPNHNGSHPEQKVQATQTRRADAAISSGQEPQMEITHEKQNALTTTRNQTNQRLAKKINHEEKQTKTSPEESPIHTPMAASLLENPEKIESPPVVPPETKSSQPSKKKSSPHTTQDFPSTIFLRLW